MDSNERKIVQELVTVLGCVLPATDGYEPRTNLWNKYTAAKNMLAAAPQVVADERALPPPFFYYESNEDGSVEWNEGCVCKDDVYTNAEYAKENGTHGGKVYSEAQMRAALQAAPVQAQELSDATIINAANKYGISPHAAMPFVRELIASQSTVQEIRAVANPVEFDGIKTDAVKAQEPVAGKPCPYCGSTDCTHDKAYPHPRAPVQPVAVPDDEEEDFYSHACEVLEQGQNERAKRGVEIGTQGSLCDGISWLFYRLEKLESAAPAAQGDALADAYQRREAYYAHTGNSTIDYDGREWGDFIGGWDAAIAAKAAS